MLRQMANATPAIQSTKANALMSLTTSIYSLIKALVGLNILRFDIILNHTIRVKNTKIKAGMWK